MVIFITDKNAYSEMKKLILSGEHVVWFASDVLEQNEIETLWGKGINVSVFDYEIDANNYDDLMSALDTIKEQHPDQNVWVQFKNGICY